MLSTQPTQSSLAARKKTSIIMNDDEKWVDACLFYSQSHLLTPRVFHEISKRLLTNFDFLFSVFF